MKQKRVLLMVRGLTLGGSERQAAVVAAGLDRSRFECHVACVHPEGIRADELRRSHIPIHVFPLRSLRRPSALFEGLRLTRFIRKNRIDLVHTFDPPMNIFGVPFARLAGTCQVLSSMRSHRGLVTPNMRRLLRLSDRLAHGIVVNCDSVRRQLIAEDGVPNNHIQLCHNGIDTEAFHPQGRGPIPEFGNARLVIGSVCALRPEKGLTTLIDAFARVCIDRPDIRLGIVGSGPALPELQDHAANAGCRDQVVFVPESSDVARFLRAMDVFVLPSRSEALSNSLMEAMACGCAAVASRVGGNVELIQHDRTGLLFESGNALDLGLQLELMIRETELRRRLAESAAARIREEFSLPTSIDRMSSIYSAVLE
jgi:glycosyltransferase involved in cell wall biosynthesis